MTRNRDVVELNISEDLEQGLLSALVKGVISLDDVPIKSLSMDGKAVCAGYEFLVKCDKKPPFNRQALVSAACDVAGADKAKIRPYIEEILKLDSGSESLEMVRKLNEQLALAELVTEASKQIASREFDVTALTQCFTAKSQAKLVPACDLLVGDQLPPIPTGYTLPSLPSLTNASGGLMGVWAVGGKAKMGKTTLGMQIALDAPIPVIYYDMENGEQVLLYRIGKAFGGDVGKVKERMKNFYFRRSISTLQHDLMAVPAPALVVVDSIQKLPTKLDQRRTGIDHWLNKFERLKERGYTVLLISEVNGLGGYKETSEVEYTVDFGLQLVRHGSDIVANVVANRHRQDTGEICALQRVNDWMWQEAEALGGDTGDL